jgi:hypothetical protein
MGKIFEWDARKGNYLDSISKTEGVPVSLRFSQTGKGLSLYLDSASSLAFTVPAFNLTTLISWVKGKGTLRVSVGSTDVDIDLTNNLWQFSDNLVDISNETDITITVTSGYAYVLKVIGFDSFLTVSENNYLYKEFQTSYPNGEVNRPSYIDLKPTDLSNKNGLIVAYNMIPENGQVIDVSGNGNDGIISGALKTFEGLYFNGINNYINFGQIDYNTVLSTNLHINFNSFPLSGKIYIYSLKNLGSQYFNLVCFSDGSLSFGYYDGTFYNIGRTSANIFSLKENITITLLMDPLGSENALYINGVNQSFEAGSAISVSDFCYIASRNGILKFGNFSLIDFNIYNRLLTVKEIQDYHNQFADQVYLRDDFSDEPVDSDKFSGWLVGSGSFKSAEEVITEVEGSTPILNAGASGTTDWVDTDMNGLADNMNTTESPSSVTYSIITGSGFTGNAQRFDINVTTQVDFRTDPFSLINGETYMIRFKYRTDSTNMQVSLRNASTFVTKAGSGILATNTGNAVEYTTSTFVAGSENYIIQVLGTSAGNYYEIDEIAFIQVVYDVTVFPPEVDLSNYTSAYKYLECVTNGIVSTQSTEAYGNWEFSIYHTFNNLTRVNFISNIKGQISDFQGYMFQFTGTEVLTLTKSNGGTFDVLFATASGYIDEDTWYRIKIDRTVEGKFYVYIKGGSFGSSYILVDVTGGSGTNPVTDNTYTTSKYLVFDADTGDRLTSLKKKGLNSFEQNNILSSYFPLTM